MKDKLMLLLKFVIFIASIALVIFGQKTVGKVYLLMQFIGLAGMIFLLWNYNRKFV